MTYVVWVGGRELADIGPHSEPVFEDLAEGGSGDASWEMVPAHGLVRWHLLADRDVEIYEAGVRVYLGRVEQVDTDEHRVHCVGRFFEGARIPALSTAGMATASASAAIAGAKARGWKVEGYFTESITGDVDEPMMITDFLRMLGTQEGKRVSVEASTGLLRMRPPATTPTYRVSTDRVSISTDSQGRVNMLVARYRDSAGAIKTAQWPNTPPARVYSETVDLTERKALTQAQAEGILQKALTKLSDRPRVTEAIRVPLSQIFTMGGANITSTAGLYGGVMVRLDGLDAAQVMEVGAPYIDVEVNVTSPDEDGLLTLTPVDATEQSLEEVMESIK